VGAVRRGKKKKTFQNGKKFKLVGRSFAALIRIDKRESGRGEGSKGKGGGESEVWCGLLI